MALRYFTDDFDTDGETLIGFLPGDTVRTASGGSVIIEVTTYANAITFYGGILSTTALAVRSLGDITGASTATITAAGLYVIPAAGTISYTGASNVVNLMLKR